MKKIIITLALFLLAIIFVPKNILAQSTSDCPTNLPYSFCRLSSEMPNRTCTNMGASAKCGGTASQLVLWCCSTDNDAPLPANAKGELFEGCDGGAINTAIGCIPINNTDEFISFVLRWAIGIGGGIAFLLIVFAGFQIMTSSGNPDRLKAGQELMTSAIAGLILLIFSVFVLRIIGVDILKLPGF